MLSVLVVTATTSVILEAVIKAQSKTPSGTKVSAGDAYGDVFRSGPDEYTVELWERPRGGDQGQPGGGGGGVSGGKKRVKDWHWLPPPGSKFSNPEIQPNASGWSIVVTKGPKGQSIDGGQGENGLPISCDPYNPTRFRIRMRGGNVSPYTILALTNDGGTTPPSHPWHENPKVLEVFSGDDKDPMPGPIIFVEGPRPTDSPFRPNEGRDLEIVGPPLLRYTALLFWMPDGDIPETLADCQERGALLSSGDPALITTASERTSETGSGHFLLELGSVEPGRYYLWSGVDDEDDGAFPSVYDLGNVVEITVII